MMKFLRIVKHNRWKGSKSNLAGDSGLHCDALLDMKTKDNCSLSVFEVRDEVGHQRVAIAIAATRKCVGPIDYTMFGGNDLKSIGISPQCITGDTPDSDVNGLHYDIDNLAIMQLAQMAEIIYAGERVHINQKSVKKLLNDAVRAGHLDETKIKCKNFR